MISPRLAAVLVVLAAAACDSAGPPTAPPPTPPPTPQHRIDVVRTSGVSGSPAAGTVTAAQGSTVQYSFTAEPGFGDLRVVLDTVALPASGSFVVDTSRVLQVTAWPIAAPPATPLEDAVLRMYTHGDAAAYREVMQRVLTASLENDAALLDQVRRAEYSALLAAGPEGMARMMDALAGTTIPLAGSLDDGGAALRDGGGSNVLFAEDTIVPTTVVVVNGILGRRAMATRSAERLTRILQSRGLGRATMESVPGSPRPGSSMMVYLHFNPIVSLQSPLDACTLEASWSLNVAGLADPDAGERSLFARAADLFKRRASTLSSCGSLLSTNFRVVQQYLDANLGSLSRPDMQDLKLASLVAAERRRGGGRNIVVVGHSHGSVIARSVVGASGPLAEHAGCLGALALGSPLGTSTEWPNQQWLQRIIARGDEIHSWDLLYPLGLSRSDGRRSVLTARLDDDLRSGWVGLFPFFRQLALHGLDESYLAENGHADAVGDALAGGYRALAQSCSGRLTGEVRDFATGEALAGARVSLRMGGRERSSATSGADGRFQTAAAHPVLHDLVISADGFRSDTLFQRLVAFNATVPVQEGPIYLGRDCERTDGVCDLTGTYASFYHLSGSREGIPVACSFRSTVRLVQTGGTVEGTVSTDAYQRGCETDGGYVHWGVGTWAVDGTVAGDAVMLNHPAIPPWVLNGRAYLGGFHVTEPAWLTGGGFRLRVEISARRTGEASLESLPATDAGTPPQPIAAVRR